MSAQKTLSQLSLAAIALLVVAIPSFAQTETTDKTSAASVTDSAVVAVNRESATRESVVEKAVADTNTKAAKFSADKFMQSVNESPNVTIKSSSVFRPMPNNFERKNSSRITFVPSVKPAAPGVTQ